jgi:aquaporin Z
MDTSSLDRRALFAEFIGTGVFFAIAFMCILSTLATGSLDLVVIAAGFGFGLLAAIMIGGAISGGHFNPAVTLAAVLDRRMDAMTGVAYVVAQIAGGILGTLLVLAVSNQDAVVGVTTQPGSGMSDLDVLLLEIVFTAAFIAVILTVTAKAANYAAFAIPVTLFVIHLALVPFTGTSVNPARSIAPAVVGGEFDSLWIYIVATLIGALIGWGVFRVLSDEGEERADEMRADAGPVPGA